MRHGAGSRSEFPPFFSLDFISPLLFHYALLSAALPILEIRASRPCVPERCPGVSYRVFSLH